jgi:hypothetical protein
MATYRVHVKVFRSDEPIAVLRLERVRFGYFEVSKSTPDGASWMVPTSILSAIRDSADNAGCAGIRREHGENWRWFEVFSPSVNAMSEGR